MIQYIRYCEVCGEAYDIDISKDRCPNCRGIKKEEKEDVETERD